jgi:hypothetical protein
MKLILFELLTLAKNDCGLYKRLIRLDMIVSAKPPNGVRYRRLGRERLGNGKLPKLKKKPQKRTESQPSGARCVGRRICKEHQKTC